MSNDETFNAYIGHLALERVYEDTYEYYARRDESKKLRAEAQRLVDTPNNSLLGIRQGDEEGLQQSCLQTCGR